MTNEKIFANLEIFKAKARAAGFPIQKEIEIRIDLRGRSAGCALSSPNPILPHIIRLNKELIVTNEHEIVYEALGHELAHVLQAEYTPKVRPHGKEFKAFAAILGVSTSTYHSMEVKPSRVYRKFEYSCGCEEKHSVTTIIHNRILKGRVYSCKKCNQELKHAGV